MAFPDPNGANRLLRIAVSRGLTGDDVSEVICLSQQVAAGLCGYNEALALLPSGPVIVASYVQSTFPLFRRVHSMG